MNTRKLFFGMLAMFVLVAVSVGTTVTIEDDQEPGIRKTSTIRKR